jgi:hypothetical protein
MRGWVILVATFLVGAAVGFGAASRGPGLIAPYLPKAGGGSGEHIEGQVVRKQRDGNRLLVKITKDRCSSPSLQKVADLDVLLDPGDTVTLMIPGYATFVEDPVFERIKAAGPAKGPA